MEKKFKTFVSRPSVDEPSREGSVMALTKEAVYSLYKKSQKSDIPFDVLEQVYQRGYSIWNESFGDSPEQFAFDRVNSFISGGFASDLDDDLIENRIKVNNMSARDLIKNHAEPKGFKLHRTTGSHDIHKHPDGRTLAVPRHKGDLAPGTSRQLMKTIYNESMNEEVPVSEPKTTDKSKPSSRFVGTDSLVNILKNDTPGQSSSSSTLAIIKKVIKS